MRTLFIYGAGGFGREVLDIALQINCIERRWGNIRFIDDFTSADLIEGIKVLPMTRLIDSSSKGISGVDLVIANGDPRERKTILEKIRLFGLEQRLTTIVHPSARVSSSARIDKGVIVCGGTQISTNAELSLNVVINCNSIVGHDVTIGMNSIISSQVNLGGGVKVEDMAFIGMGSLIREGTVIGSQSIVGMGSTVHNDVSANTLVMGNPARPIRKAESVSLYKNKV